MQPGQGTPGKLVFVRICQTVFPVRPETMLAISLWVSVTLTCGLAVAATSWLSAAILLKRHRGAWLSQRFRDEP